VRLPYLSAALAIAAADQATKTWAARSLALEPPREVIPGLFRLVLVRNRGALFGILHDLAEPVRTLLFLALPVVVIAALCWLAWRTPPVEVRSHAAYALLLGGAVGNLIDRLRLGHVVDFLDFYVTWPAGATYHWPAFNLADACICTGIALLALESWRARPTATQGDAHAPDSD
jgi:signal peptidase II